MRVFLTLFLPWLQLGSATGSSSSLKRHNLNDYHGAFRSGDYDDRLLQYSVPPEEHPDLALYPEEIIYNFVSAALGSDMVLQRDTEAVLWGYSQEGAEIVTTLQEEDNEEGLVLTMTTIADGPHGLWRQKLPPQPASLKPYTINVTSSLGENTVLENVLFGDIYICGGQSNMAFTLPEATDGHEHATEGAKYPHIRVFTVGENTASSKPLPDLQEIRQPWSVANHSSLHHPPDTKRNHFSAVCWFFGREISIGLENQVPIGLISSNWGSTTIDTWSPKGLLYNSMIFPFMVGPLRITGFAWYQGESNAHDFEEYEEDFPNLIEEWREGFQDPDAFFGFVQLSTFCHAGPTHPAEFREAQMAALKLHNVGYATNVDHGDGCNIHPPDKKHCGMRLGQSALAVEYGQNIPWRSPTYEQARVNKGTKHPSVVIHLQDVNDKGLKMLDVPHNQAGNVDCEARKDGVCAEAEVLLRQGESETERWVGAIISIHGHHHVLLTAEEGDSKRDRIIATKYGWGSVPMLWLYDEETDLPVLPWNKEVPPYDGSTHI